MSNFLETLQNWLQKNVNPIAEAINKNHIITAVSRSMMMLMPVLIGSAVFSIFANFPITAVANALSAAGITNLLNTFINTQTNLMPIFNVFLIAYVYANGENCNGLIAGVFSLLVYFILMPSTIGTGEEVISAYSTEFFGSSSIFAAIIIAILVSLLYCWFEKNNIIMKMPDTVPVFVSKCFAPLPASVVIVGIALVVSFLCSLTSQGNFFSLILTYIQNPIVKIGANVPFMVVFYTIVNLFWFFGIHPSALMSFFSPVLSVVIGGNVRALYSGEALPYLEEACAYHASMVGGTGCTLGLAIIMLLFAKSKRYKQLNKIAFAPSVFNVNEPLLFGLPIVMNSTFLIPMLIVPGLSIAIMGTLAKLGLFNNYNAMVGATIPWTMPAPITAFLAGGVPMLVAMLAVIAIGGLIFYPFFRIADKEALEEEAAEEKEAAAVTGSEVATK